MIYDSHLVAHKNPFYFFLSWNYSEVKTFETYVCIMF